MTGMGAIGTLNCLFGCLWRTFPCQLDSLAEHLGKASSTFADFGNRTKPRWWKRCDAKSVKILKQTALCGSRMLLTRWKGAMVCSRTWTCGNKPKKLRISSLEYACESAHSTHLIPNDNSCVALRTPMYVNREIFRQPQPGHVVQHARLRFGSIHHSALPKLRIQMQSPSLGGMTSKMGERERGSFAPIKTCKGLGGLITILYKNWRFDSSTIILLKLLTLLSTILVKPEHVPVQETELQLMLQIRPLQISRRRQASREAAVDCTASRLWKSIFGRW